MTRNRNISDLLDSSGDVKTGALDNVPASNDASALTTGTLDAARLPTEIVSSDTTPQLGGDLDGNGNTIDLSGSTGAFKFPVGTEAQRPSTPAEGMTRYNSDDDVLEVYANGAWSAVGEQTLPINATGGTKTTSGSNTLHTFTSSGTFTVTEGGVTDAKILVVAGGGGGGAGWYAGGGGAGGWLEHSGITLTKGAYTVTVGAGGSGSTSTSGGSTNGGNSQFGSLTASIGGGGGASRGEQSGKEGKDGGSGGGAAYPSTQGGDGTTGQGKDGGDNNSGQYGAGGGGASVAGDSGSSSPYGGNGGTGKQWSVNSTYYAGGGGGGTDSSGTAARVSGGTGGGGNASRGGTNGTAGGTNTGGGGGGGSNQEHSASGLSGAKAGKAGGSGIVIVSYPTPS